MYLKIDEEVLKRIEKITMTDYEAEGSFLPSEVVTDIIEDLLLEIDRLQEKYEDLEEDLEENYKPISLGEQYDISDRVFL